MQPTTARLDLSIWRNDDVYEFPLRVLGPSLSGTTLRAQIRLAPDTPGEPLANLSPADNANAEGVRLASSVLAADGQYVNDVRIRINKSTRQAFPYAGEVGDNAQLAWAFQINGRTRLEGLVLVLAHTMDSDNAPSSRPAGSGAASSQGTAPMPGATLIIAENDGATVLIDGADLLGGLMRDAGLSAAASADSAQDAQDAADSILALKPAILGARTSLGEMAGYARAIATPINGAVPLGDVAKGTGLRFPNGLGNNSTLFVDAPLLDADRRVIPIGTKVHVVMAFSTTPGFREFVGPSNDAEQTVVTYDNDTGTFTEGDVDPALSGFLSDTVYVRATTATWTGNNKRLGQRLQFDQVKPSGAEYDIRFQSAVILVDSVPSASAMTLDDLAKALSIERKRLGYAQTFTIGGAFGNPPELTTAALTSFLGTRSDETRGRLVIPATTTVANNVRTPAYADLSGYQRQTAIVVNFLPDTAPAQSIADFEILRVDYSARLERTSGYIRTGRYYTHIEGAGAIKDQTIVISHVEWRHQGNAGARAYVASQGGDPNSVFASTVPIGIGTGSGNHITIEFSRLRGEAGAILWHDNLDFERPSPLDVIGNALVPDSIMSPFLSLTTLGSFIENPVKIIGNDTRGLLALNGASPWAQADPAKNPADHFTGHLDVFGYANGEFGVVVSDPGRCIRIRHATAGAGFVSVSGPLLATIFGPEARNRATAGAEGWRATYDGYLDIKGGGYTAAGNTISLGNRLGNLGAAPSSFIVSGTGFANRTVTLNQDYRGQSNDTILTAINNQLGGFAVAYEYAPGLDFRPRFTDREATMFNTGTLTMLAGTMVAYLPGGYACRNAEPGDELASSIYRIGIALEPIFPGQPGRVQTAGLVNIEHVLGDSYDANGLVVGDTFKPIQVQNPAVDYFQAKGVLQRRGDGLGALRCIRPRMLQAPYSTPAFLLVG